MMHPQYSPCFCPPHLVYIWIRYTCLMSYTHVHNQLLFITYLYSATIQNTKIRHCYLLHSILGTLHFPQSHLMNLQGRHVCVTVILQHGLEPVTGPREGVDTQVTFQVWYIFLKD